VWRSWGLLLTPTLSGGRDVAIFGSPTGKSIPETLLLINICLIIPWRDGILKNTHILHNPGSSIYFLLCIETGIVIISHLVKVIE
jgi:hypothetical protein